jgi:hypothetical protein
MNTYSDYALCKPNLFPQLSKIRCYVIKRSWIKDKKGAEKSKEQSEIEKV